MSYDEMDYRLGKDKRKRIPGRPQSPAGGHAAASETVEAETTSLPFSFGAALDRLNAV